LPVLLDISEPVIPVMVVCAAAIVHIVGEVSRVVGKFHLVNESVLLGKELLEPVFHRKFLMCPLLHHELFLEFT